MLLRNTFGFIFFSFLIGVISLYCTVTLLSPFALGLTAVLLFYFSLFLTSISFFTLLGFGFRTLFASQLYLRTFLTNSIRQAFILAVISCVSFLFLHLSYFSYLNLFWLLCIGFLVEIFYFKFRNLD